MDWSGNHPILDKRKGQWASGALGLNIVRDIFENGQLPLYDVVLAVDKKWNRFWG